ncbi:ATP-binding protein [Streptomyces sp. DSM 44915]|uniref:ATP-binding protein n=1 Tax=Streptomyces chisholmiae TaxID=3075540 RepID=A0ABU2JM18_9ACTN|nr:ATP-binding protein [Streptomyces sp. DSM 44915]MDT0266025.1 ATP-binding protein [Streptomyces sp. DSM 44915]
MASSSRVDPVVWQNGSTPPSGCLRFRLPAIPTSAAEARRLTREQLREWRMPGEASDSAQLVISELVTNALRHTESDTVGCEVRLLGSLLRVAVASEGSGPRGAPRTAGTEDEGGRGLLLVCSLAQVWGVRPHDAGAGHVVWADLPLDTAA